MEHDGDLGPDLLAGLLDALELEKTWTVRAERSFTWWGDRLAQHVWADPPQATPAGPVVRVHAQTDVLRGITEDEGTAARVSSLNRLASLSGIVWEAGQGEAALHLAVSMGPDDRGWLAPLLAEAVAVQAAEAHHALEEWAHLLGGTPADSAHPEHGPRRRSDQRLDEVPHVFAKLGAEVSPFTETDFEALLASDPVPWSRAERAGRGIVAHLPFGAGEEHGVLTLSAETRHPLLGAGCLVRLSVPPGHGDTAETAARLGRQERHEFTPAQSLGGWCGAHDPGLAYLSFLPAAVYEPGLLHHMIEDAVRRAEWVRRRLRGHL